MSLDRLWSFLEARPAGAAVIAEWRERCGEQLPATESVLHPTQARASLHPALTPGLPPLRVVRHRDGTIVGVCDQGRSERAVLSPSDVVIHAVDPAALRRQLCAALGLRIAHEPVGRLPGTLRIGHWEPQPALAIPVVLVAVTTEAAMLTALHDLAAGARKPPLVLTPGRAGWTVQARAAADSARATLVPLADVLVADGASWKATDAWDGYRQGHLVAAGLSTPAKQRAAAPKRKRASRATALDGLKRELREHLRAAKAHYHATATRGRAELLPRPTQQDLAKRLGVSEPTVSRCLNDEPDQELKVLWASAEDIDLVRKYRG
ncbi:MAG: winged helix-turn-helix domain-containing protein [Phycisphaeraceae bacterium]|nr:winged helix-turn-helix domain-containing protein [Phycisphaeraceae bacterium]